MPVRAAVDWLLSVNWRFIQISDAFRAQQGMRNNALAFVEALCICLFMFIYVCGLICSSSIVRRLFLCINLIH